MASEVLVCGTDADLLRTRASVLSSAGFQVQSVFGVAELERYSRETSPALIILCHSLSPQDQTTASEYAGRVWPDCPVLFLNARNTGIPAAGTCFNTFEGPAKLIEISRRLTGQQ